MSDDLVKRLRKTPNWKREEYGDYKSAMVHYDRAPFEAADRIEELEAKNKRLNEQMDAIEEMGTESLNALPDCLMRLAPALVENGELKAQLAKAVETLERIEDASKYFGNCPEASETTVRYAHETTRRLCSTTIAALKGQDDE